MNWKGNGRRNFVKMDLFDTVFQTRLGRELQFFYLVDF